MSVKFSETQLMIRSIRASGLSFAVESKCSVMKWLHAGVPFLSPKTVILRSFRKDRAALVPFSPWSSDMSQKFIHLFASAILSGYRRDGCSVEMARVFVLLAFCISLSSSRERAPEICLVLRLLN